MASPDVDEILFEPIEHPSPKFRLVVSLLTAGTLLGVYCWIRQMRLGLGETGLGIPVSWGFYVTNFVFFIGISHAGTLISAILRISRAEWRRPITRMAEFITVAVLAVGGLQIIIDMGRPDRLLNILWYGRYQSPLLWDATSITAYFVASSVYLYVPMIPDIAMLRDRGARPRFAYAVLAMGWQGTTGQKRVLSRAIAILAVLVIPIAVSVHTVVAFVFSMTLQPGWHSTVFGPYFVVGAIFSGIAALLLAMILFRSAYGLQSYIKDVHFNYLGILLLVMSLLWFYFTFVEYLTTYYGGEPDELAVFWQKWSGPYAIFFWAMGAFNFLIPVLILSFRRGVRAVGVASLFVILGMWLERFIIVVPTLSRPRLPELPSGTYLPTWLEWGELVGSLCMFGLIYVLFTRFFPIVSVWEIQEGRAEGLREVEDRLRSYLPGGPGTESPGERT